MKISLIYPGFKEDPSGLQEPLGILYVAAVLRKGGHDVYLIDLTFNGGKEAIKKAALNSDWIFISSTTMLFENAKSVLRKIKEINPTILCVLGGSHGTISPKDAIETGFDYVIIGEGERTALRLVNSLKNPKLIKKIDGLAFKEKDKFIINQKKSFTKNLNDLPFPARDLWNYKKYFETGTTEIGIIATRGCPYNCLYCKPMVDKLFGNKTRKRSPNNVVDEIEQIVKNYKNLFKGKVKLWFKDDTLTYGDSINWFREFRDELKRRKIEIEFGCHTRVDNVSYELLKLMKKSGLTHTSFGLESGSQKILNYYRKGTTVEQAIKTFEACHKLRLDTFAYIMMGAPIETREDLDLTYQLIKKIKPGGVDAYTTTPYPGNDLYYDLQRKNLIREGVKLDYWSKKFPIKMEYLTDKDLAEYRKKIYRLNNRQLLVKYLSSPYKFKRLIKYLVNRPGFVINYLRRSL